jgi:hypothetical protein
LELYLLRTGAVVVPMERAGATWRCVVTQPGTTLTRWTQLTVSDVEIETALTVPGGSRSGLQLDRDDFNAAWLSRVWDGWSGGRVVGLATLLADLADPASRVVEMAPPTVRRLLEHLHAVPVGLRACLRRLVENGFLLQVSSPREDHWGSYEMALPQ